MIEPHAEPSSAETIEAISSANSPAPALRTTSGARTAGSSQTPYMNARPGGNAVTAVPTAAHSRFQAQKTTPKATPSTAVTTMSTVRQRAVAPVFESVADDGRTACSAMSPPDSLRRHDPDQVRGSAANRTLSAEALPCRMFGCPAERSPRRSAQPRAVRSHSTRASPSGTQRPVHGSQPGAARYAPLLPLVISRNPGAVAPAGTPA